MARCDNCNRFVALETGEPPELEGDIELEGDGTVRADVRLVRLSDCCGEEKKETMLSLEGQLGIAEDEDGDGSCEDEHDWVADQEPEPEVTERWQTHDRKGKPIRNPRYQRHYIGVTMEVEATCSRCGAKGTATLSEETTAGSFEEL